MEFNSAEQMCPNEESTAAASLLQCGMLPAEINKHGSLWGRFFDSDMQHVKHTQARRQICAHMHKKNYYFAIKLKMAYCQSSKTSPKVRSSPHSGKRCAESSFLSGASNGSPGYWSAIYWYDRLLNDLLPPACTAFSGNKFHEQDTLTGNAFSLALCLGLCLWSFTE